MEGTSHNFLKAPDKLLLFIFPFKKKTTGLPAKGHSEEKATVLLIRRLQLSARWETAAECWRAVTLIRLLRLSIHLHLPPDIGMWA